MINRLHFAISPMASIRFVRMTREHIDFNEIWHKCNFQTNISPVFSFIGNYSNPRWRSENYPQSLRIMFCQISRKWLKIPKPNLNLTFYKFFQVYFNILEYLFTKWNELLFNPLATVGAYRRLEILRLWYWERLTQFGFLTRRAPIGVWRSSAFWHGGRL